jgi:hypothetical protein
MTLTIKSGAVLCFVLCLSAFVVSAARSYTQYDLPGPGMSFLDGNEVHSWCQNDKSMAQAYTAGLWDLSARAAVITINQCLSIITQRPSEYALCGLTLQLVSHCSKNLARLFIRAR